MSMKLLFCGTPDFACESLRMLSSLKEISEIRVASQPDKVRNRGRKTSPTPVKACAEELGLSVQCPESKEALSDYVLSFNPDVIIVIAYGMILPKTITDNFLCINGHGSLLPKYRGASPIQSALLNGDQETGMTLIRMNEKMDEGDILAMESFSIEDTDNFGSLHDKLATQCAALLKQCLLEFFETKGLNAVPQDHSQASYCSKITKEQLLLQTLDSKETTLQKIKAFSPVPGAYTFFGDKRIKVLDAALEQGTIVPLLVQPEGKKPMPYHDFVQGYQTEIQL